HAATSRQYLPHLFMAMTLITSPSNPRIGKLRDLHTTRGRRENGLFLMEGPHLLEALFDAEVLPLEVYYQPELLQRTTQGSALLARLLETLSPESCIEVSERVIEALGDVQTSQGVISVLPLNAFDPERLRTQRMRVLRPVLLILDAVSDPGNMGTILRTALATDVTSVLLTSGCVDCYNPKVVRAAAGAHITLPIESNLDWSTIEEKVTRHCAGHPRLLLADAGSPHLYYEQDFTQHFALIIGNEAKGPSREARQRATLTISIPLANHVESLNAAMATGIMLYEAVRQKRTR
ncbi:MAG: RNA methyltransferase, partial [Ktedonobacteraceae bacterium]